MAIRLIYNDSENYVEQDNEIKRIRYFYNRYERLWTILLQNLNGDQIGDAEYAVSKDDLKSLLNSLKDEYNVTDCKKYD